MVSVSEPGHGGLADSGVREGAADLAADHGGDSDPSGAPVPAGAGPRSDGSGNWWDPRRPGDQVGERSHQPDAPSGYRVGPGPDGGLSGGAGDSSPGGVTAAPASDPIAQLTRPGGRPPDAAGRGPRRARLQLRNVDPWSMLKFSLVLAIALFVVWMVVVGVLYGVLNGTGVFGTLNRTVGDIVGNSQQLINPQVVFGVAAVVGAVNIVLFTAFATLGSFIYNICADMVGGLEVTLAEHD